jgi:hypothetical protein
MKILILSFFLVLCSLLYSQGNLQFNQVLTYSQSHGLAGCGSNVCSWTGPTYAVPVGKVWKIEYFAQSGQYPASLVFNNSFSIASINSSPLWLKAGDQVQLKTGCIPANCASGGAYLLSIVEFNIIP